MYIAVSDRGHSAPLRARRFYGLPVSWVRGSVSAYVNERRPALFPGEVIVQLTFVKIILFFHFDINRWIVVFPYERKVGYPEAAIDAAEGSIGRKFDPSLSDVVTKRLPII